MHQPMADLVRAIDTDGFWRQLMAVLKPLIAFEDLVVIGYRPQHQPICYFHELSPKRFAVLIKDYLDGPFLLDPLYPALMERGLQGFHPVLSVAPDKFTSSRYYEVHYARTQIKDELALLVRPSGGTGLVISLLRVKSMTRFGQREVAKLRAIEPLLLAVIEQHARRRLDQPQTSAAQQMVQSLEQVFADISTRLTPREVEIAAMVLRGHSSLSISSNLAIVEGTVKIHRKNIYKKLNISSQAELFSLFLSRIIQAMPAA